MNRGGRAWSFRVSGDEREFQGNAGYEDVPEESYSYDSDVGNHKQVAKGDLVVVRNAEEALGVACIERVDVIPGAPKERRRCPSCGDTSIHPRATKPPSERYVCSHRGCKIVFAQPRVEMDEVTAYCAHYGATWQSLEACLGKSELERLALGRSKQQSIRAMDRAALLAAVAARGVRLPSPAEATAPSRRHHPGSLPGGRRRAEAAARRGQEAFRRALIHEYGMVCAVTGPAPAEALQAAHLRPFAEHEEHHVEEGLMLRADIHGLLDNGLLAISPDLQVHVSPSLLGYDTYRALQGSCLHIPPDAPLSTDVLREAYEAITGTW